MFQAVAKTVTAVQQTSHIELQYSHFFLRGKKIKSTGNKVGLFSINYAY